MIQLKTLALACSPSIIHPFLHRISSSDIGYRLACGMFWAITGAVISRAMTLFAMIIVAKMLGKAVYGELGVIQSTISMFGIFAGFGLGLTTTKFVAEFRISDPERAGRIITISEIFAVLTGGLMAIGLFVSSHWLCMHTIKAPHLEEVLRIAALILFINALNGAQIGALSGFEAFQTIATINLIVGLFSFPILIVAVYIGGLKGVIWGLSINFCFQWLIYHFALRRETKKNSVPLTIKHCSSEWPVLIKFSFPAVLAGSMVGPVNWACNALLVNQPGGYGEMGIYNVTNQWFAILMFLPGMLGRVVLPILSNQVGQNKEGKYRKTLVLAIKANIIIITPFAILLSIASPYIMRLYGNGFVEGWPTLIVVLLTAWILAIQIPIGNIIAASGWMWTGFAMNFGWALCFLAITLFLVEYGSIGLASARMFSYIIHSMWTFGFAIWLINKGSKK